MQKTKTKAKTSNSKNERAGSVALDVIRLFLTGEPIKMADICQKLNKRSYTISKVIHRLLSAEIIEPAPHKEKDGRLKSYKLKMLVDKSMPDQGNE